MNNFASKTKVALLVNIIAPSRLRLYSLFAEQFDLLILHGGTEGNRDFWEGLEKQLPNAKVLRAWGWQLHYTKKVHGEAFDEKFVHVTPGFAWGLLRFRPAAVITNEMGFRTLLALTYGMLFGKPVWVWWGGTLHTERGAGRLRKAVRRIIALWARHWISYGQSSTEYLLRLGVRRERILESQNGVDEEEFEADVEPAWSIQPRPVVLYTGQFIERKGVVALLNAAAAAQRVSEFSLLLVGNGPDRKALEQRAKTLGLKNVHFRPAQVPSHMPAVYRSGDVLVFPTREDVWGLVANEAILSGTQVLCSKYAGCAQELFSGESIFDPENHAEFAYKLGEVVAGRIPRPDRAGVKSISEIANGIIRAIESAVSRGIRAVPSAESQDLK